MHYPLAVERGRQKKMLAHNTLLLKKKKEKPVVLNYTLYSLKTSETIFKAGIRCWAIELMLFQTQVAFENRFQFEIWEFEISMGTS